MGRYYNGDIEGKFWFGVQSSTDASFFGGEKYEPNYVEYQFITEDLPTIKEGIDKCNEALGNNKEKLDRFFEKNNGYNDDMLKKDGLDPSLIEWYARLDLGVKIFACVTSKGECNFEAEL